MSTTRIGVEMSEDFRLLVAEIMETEGLPWHQAAARARAEWADVGEVDPTEPAGEPARDWRFIAWLLLLALSVSLSVNLGFVWVLATYGGQ